MKPVNYSQRLVALGLRAFLRVLAVVPRGFACFLTGVMADLFFRLDHRHRRIGLANLRIAFPESSAEELRSILRASYRRIGTHAVELAWLTRAKREDFRRRFSYEPGRGLEHYLQARASGKGVLFLTAHIGAWELLPAAHAVLGHPLSFVVRPLDNPLVDDWSRHLRERFGNRVISKFGSLRKIVRELESGGDVGFLIDQNVQEKDGVFVPLFGRPAATTGAPALLALKTGSSVIAGFLIPGERPGHYRIRFYPPIEFTGSGDRQRDVLELTSRFNGIIESVIREFPEFWLWGHRRFGTQPDGTDPYLEC